jgi:hypothetical protein
MDAVGMALAVCLLLSADEGRSLTTLALRQATPESFFVRTESFFAN